MSSATKGILVTIVVLVIILVGVVSAWWFFFRDSATPDAEYINPFESTSTEPVNPFAEDESYQNPFGSDAEYSNPFDNL